LILVHFCQGFITLIPYHPVGVAQWKSHPPRVRIPQGFKVFRGLKKLKKKVFRGFKAMLLTYTYAERPDEFVKKPHKL
jgi:hypothetical protein